MKHLVDEAATQTDYNAMCKYDNEERSQVPERQEALFMKGRMEPCLKFAGPSHTPFGASVHSSKWWAKVPAPRILLLSLFVVAVLLYCFVCFCFCTFAQKLNLYKIKCCVT